jgi:hypothetical protein
MNQFGVEDYSRPYATFDRPCKCTCYCWQRPEINMTLNNNNFFLGKVLEPFTCCDPLFYVYNAKGDITYRFSADCCQCGVCCRDFPCESCSEALWSIHKADKSPQTCNIENRDGTIRKTYTGCMQEWCTNADTYEIIFPVGATAEDKFMIISGAIMVDYMYYENKKNNN